MARPYSPPMDRKRMRPSMESPAPDVSLGASVEGGEPPASSSSGNGDAGEPLTAFLPKEFFGDRECKPGDEYTIRIKAVDPDTGEKEVEFAGGEMPAAGEPESATVAGIDELEE
jgi:hypothetical protein